MKTILILLVKSLNIISNDKIRRHSPKQIFFIADLSYAFIVNVIFSEKIFKPSKNSKINKFIAEGKQQKSGIQFIFITGDLRVWLLYGKNSCVKNKE